MRDIRFKDVWMAFVIVAIAWIGMVAYIHPAGYCREQSRYISDAELVSIAISSRARSIEGLPDTPSVAEISKFVRDNPGCCVLRDDEEGPFAKAFATFLASGKWVQILYQLKARALSADQPMDRAYDARVLVSPCGQRVGFSGWMMTIDQMNSEKSMNRKREN